MSDKLLDRRPLRLMTLWVIQAAGWALLCCVIITYIIEINASLSALSALYLLLGFTLVLFPSIVIEALQYLGELAGWLDRIIYSLFTYIIFFVLFFVPIFMISLKVSKLFSWWKMVLEIQGKFYRGMIGFILFILFIFFFVYFVNHRLKNSDGTARRIVERLSQWCISATALILVLFILEYAANIYLITRDQSWNGQIFYYPYVELYYPDDVDLRVLLHEFELFDYPLYYDEDYELAFHHDFRGEYINVIDRFRPTPNQPDKYDHTIYVFGGSTVFCLSSPDLYTMPSYLQQEVLKIDDVRYRVLNRGVSGYSIDNQVSLLELTELQPGDVVVFLDGINDSQKYFGNYFFTYSNQNVTKHENLLVYWMQDLNYRSNFYRFFLAAQNFQPPINRNEIEISQQLVRLFHNEIKSIWKAKEYTEDSGAIFVHFLQPVLFRIPEISRHENSILNNFLIIPNGYVDLMNRAYDVFGFLESKYPEWGIDSYDITHVFNPVYRKTGYELYLSDWMHVSPEGDQILAEQVFLRLRPYLSQGE